MSIPRRTVKKSASGIARQTAIDPWPSFLGRGWAFPPTFSRAQASVSMVAGEADIRESLWILLSTNPGERIMLPTYGCDLWGQVFTALTMTSANEIANMVTNAIVEWEPRIKVESVTVTEATDGAGWLDIRIDYMVLATNTRSNLVFPFYRVEMTIPTPGG
ncbi:MAG: GPW/gp25 family protein [Acetobacteraceae bacterium]|jgi:phage baseplate assembly protein W